MCWIKSQNLHAQLKDKNILGGIKIDTNKILVCTTEMNSEEEIDEYINALV
jgi:hypothetical protein